MMFESKYTKLKVVKYKHVLKHDFEMMFERGHG